MIKPWKELEGLRFGIDVGSTAAEALTAADPAIIHFTTDGRIVLNGELFTPDAGAGDGPLVIPLNLSYVTAETTSDELSEAFGGRAGFTAAYQALRAGREVAFTGSSAFRAAVTMGTGSATFLNVGAFYFRAADPPRYKRFRINCTVAGVFSITNFQDYQLTATAL